MHKGSIIKETTLQDLPSKKSKLGNDHQLNIGDRIEFGKEKRRNGINYYQVKTDNGLNGWVKKDDIFKWKVIKIDQEEGTHFNTFKKDETPTRKHIPKDTAFYITEAHKPKPFVYQVMDGQGNEGKIPGTVKFIYAKDDNSDLISYLYYPFVGIGFLYIVFNFEDFFASGARVPVIVIILGLVFAFFVFFIGFMIFQAVLKEIIRQISIRL